MYTDFGENLKKLRKSMHLTQEQLGGKCGISAAAVSKYESGAVKPSLEVATDIAHYLNVSPDTLFGTLEKNTIPTQGLTEEQLRIVTQLVELFCRQNASRFPAFTAQQYELIGRIVVEFSRKR